MYTALHNRLRWGGCVALALLLAATAQAQPATQPARNLVTGGVDRTGQVQITVGRSAVVDTARPYKRVSIAQPEVADFNTVSPTSVLITGKKAGITQLIIWDDNERSQTVDVVVRADMQEIQDQLKAMFPRAKIQATSANGTIILRGQAPSVEVAEQATQIAASHSGGKVLNFIEVAGVQQVMLQVRFAEVSRSASSALGINGAFSSGSFFGGNNVGQVNNTNLVPGRGSRVGDTPTPDGMTLNNDQTVSPAVTLYGGGQIGSFFLEVFVEALRQNNLLRILAEPSLIAISGQEASFLAGGEFPIPVTQGSGTGTSGTAITIEYREFGVKLVFVPVVMGDGRIRLKIAPEVSDLDFTTAVRFGGFVVPGLSVRRVSTTVELGDGQSFAVAGLLNNSVTASKEVVPFLGDLPVLGPLFRSVRYQRKETELVVLVTPRLVSPMNPGEVPTLPGEQWRHPTENELFWKQDIGGPTTPAGLPKGAAAGSRPAPLFYGPYGFTPPPAEPARAPRP